MAKKEKITLKTFKTIKKTKTVKYPYYMKYKYGALDTGHTVYKKIYKTKMFEIKIYDGTNAFDFHEVKLKNQIHIDWNYKKENKSNKKEFNAAKECVLTKIKRMKTKFHDWAF